MIDDATVIYTVNRSTQARIFLTNLPGLLFWKPQRRRRVQLCSAREPLQPVPVSVSRLRRTGPQGPAGPTQRWTTRPGACMRARSVARASYHNIILSVVIIDSLGWNANVSVCFDCEHAWRWNAASATPRWNGATCRTIRWVTCSTWRPVVPKWNEGRVVTL